MKDNNKANTRLLIVALSLMFVIIALAIAIVVLSTANKNSINSLSNDNLAKECLLMNSESSIMDCLDEKASTYYDEGDCGKALQVYDDIPTDAFDKHFLSNLYNEAYSISIGCDESLQNYWNNKFKELSNQLEGRN